MTEYLIEYGQPVSISYVQSFAVGPISASFIDIYSGEEFFSNASVVQVSTGTYDITIPGNINIYDRHARLDVTYSDVSAIEHSESFHITLRRPYATAAELALELGLTIATTPTGPTQIKESELVKYEKYAFERINAITVNYFNKELTSRYYYGHGKDSIGIDTHIISVEKVTRDSELSYDRENALTPDGLIYYPGPNGDAVFVDHSEGSVITFAPDEYPVFNNGSRYELKLVTGYEVVPAAIKQATALLVNDFRCNDYGIRNHYIVKQESQFGKTEYDARAFGGTGNVSIDDLISPYVKMPMRVI